MPELNGVSIIGEGSPILQYSYGIEKANTYIIEDAGHAVMIDACSEGIAEVLKRQGIIPDYLILTHEHCDHLWGVNAVRSAFPNLRMIAQSDCSDAICDSKQNKAKQYHIYATLRFGEGYQNDEAKNGKYTCSPADIVFEEMHVLHWHGCCFELSHAPGHSPGSTLVFMKGVGVFSGDSILREDTFLKFDGGDEAVFNSVTLPQIQSIPDNILILPGHGDVFRMSKWRKQS